MSNVIPFPIQNPQCQAATMGGLSTPELRRRAFENHYSADRRAGFDAIEAYDRATAFLDEMDRINARFGRS
jgi:hypothetical protein